MINFYIFFTENDLGVFYVDNISTMSTNFTSKNTHNLFICATCDFKCSKKTDYNRHLLTLKHENQQKSTYFTPENIACICGKKYKERSGLWRHKKKCTYVNGDMVVQDKDAVILNLLKQNGDLHKSLIEMSKEKSITNNNNNCHNTNTTNNSFNLQLFLNETCKDALNITDFVSSIKLTLEDLENTGRKGYIEGISNIILKNLKGLEQHQRPIHCSDIKREVLYIKEKDHWTKESEEKPVLTKAIKVIANENMKKITDWRNLNPDCTDIDSTKNNLYLKIVSNSMNGTSKEESDKNMCKIISNVAKEVTITKPYE